MVAISATASYFALSFFSLVILLGAALARRTAARSPAADRWAIAAGILIALHVLWLITGLLAPSSIMQAALERMLGVLTAALLGWAALARSAGRTADRLTMGVIALAAGLFVASVLFTAPTTPFNTSFLDLAWSALGLSVGVVAVLAMILRRPPSWGIFTIGLSFLLAGQAAHVSTVPADPTAAPFIVLAQAAAAPVITLGAVTVLMREATLLEDRSTARSAALRTLHGFLSLTFAETAIGYAAALTEALGTVLRAEFCLLLTPPSSTSGLTIGAGFNLIRNTPVASAPLDAEQCPLIVKALNLGRSVRLPAGSQSPDSGTVLRAIGLDRKAPGLLVPLPANGGVVAGLLLLSPYAQREWEDDARSLIEDVAPTLGGRMQSLLTRPSTTPAPAERQSLEQALQRIQELEARLAASAEAETGLRGVDDLRQQLEESRLAIEILEAETERMRTGSRSSASEATPAPARDNEQLKAELVLALQALADSRSSPRTSAAPPKSSFLASDGLLASLQEFRQPLTAISGYTELLLGEKIGLLGANQRRFLSRIRSAVRRMDIELAAMTRALSGLVASAVRQPTDMAGLIEQALEVIHDDLRAKDLTVRLDLPSAALMTALDPESVRTIVARLLTNAAEASPAGREILLRVTPARDDRVVIVTVADLGHGVPPADLNRVFSGSRWRDPVRGLGQDVPGLALVKSLTESIGGRVWVDSVDGGGTTFTVVLPSP